MIPSAKASVPADVVVAGRVDGGEHLRTSHPPEPEHRALASRKRESGFLGSVIVPSPVRCLTWHPRARIAALHDGRR